MMKVPENSYFFAKLYALDYTIHPKMLFFIGKSSRNYLFVLETVIKSL